MAKEFDWTDSAKGAISSAFFVGCTSPLDCLHGRPLQLAQHACSDAHQCACADLSGTDTGHHVCRHCDKSGRRLRGNTLLEQAGRSTGQQFLCSCFTLYDDEGHCTMMRASQEPQGRMHQNTLPPRCCFVARGACSSAAGSACASVPFWLPSHGLPVAAAGAHCRSDCVVCVHLPDANSCLLRAGAGAPDGLPRSHGHGRGGGLPRHQQPLLRVSGPVHPASSLLTSRAWPSLLSAGWPQRTSNVQCKVLRKHSLWDTVSAQL